MLKKSDPPKPNLTSDVGKDLDERTTSKRPLPDALKRRIAVRRALKGGK